MTRFVSRPGTPAEHTNFVVEDTAYGRIVLYVASLSRASSDQYAHRLNHLAAIRPGLSTDEIKELSNLVEDWQPGRYLESA